MCSSYFVGKTCSIPCQLSYCFCKILIAQPPDVSVIMLGAIKTVYVVVTRLCENNLVSVISCKCNMEMFVRV